MIVYNLILAVSVFAGIPLCRTKVGKIIYCTFEGLLLFFVAAVRSHVGYDYNSYGSEYINSVSLTVEELAQTRLEKGFLMICKLLADYIVGYQILFIVMAAVIIVPLMICIYKYCDKPYLAVFGFLTLGLYFNSLDFLRQVIAAVIVLCGLRYTEKGNFFRFAVVVVFASCFHISAFMMILFYFILKLKVTPTLLTVYSVVSAGTFIFSREILLIVTKYVYSGYDPDKSIHMKTGLDPIYTIYFAIIFFTAFALRKSLMEKDSFNNVLINCMFFTFFFEFIGIKHSIVSRPALYFALPAAVWLVPQIIEVLLEKCSEKFKDDKHKLAVSKAAVVMSVAVIFVGMFEYMIVKDYNGVMPYQTIFTEEAEE